MIWVYVDICIYIYMYISISFSFGFGFFFKLGFFFLSSQFKTKFHLNKSSPMAASALPSSSPPSSPSPSPPLPLPSSNPNSSRPMSSLPSTPDSSPHLDDLDETHHFSTAPAPFPVASPSPSPTTDTDADRMFNLPTQPTQSPPTPTLLYLAFNQNQACFSAGTTSGFRIFNCDPLSEICRCENLPPLSNPACANAGGGGIEVVQMLFRHTLFALVGGGPAPQYPLNKVMIWGGHEVGCIGELTFNSEVKSVRLKRDSIVVVLLKKIYVYEFPSLKVEHQVETMLNPRGLCEVSHTSGSRVLVCPGQHKGQVRVEHYSSNRTKYISAHDSRIACIALTNDGRFLATASSKGTLIRVHNTLDGSLLQEVRRGADRAEIYSLAFSSTAQWLAVSSDKGTIHVFNLRFESGSLGSGSSCSPSAVSHLSFIRGVLPKYFSSEWSVAQFRLQEGLKSIVAFGHQKNTVVILGMDGSFYRCQYDPVMGGEMTQLEYLNFLELKNVL